jgi:trans-2,3-dihydro-3-hydroxyanthranilate isomerase
MGHRLAWLDVFTSRALLGNGLAVVHDADDLDDATMLAFARETRLSETTFVQSASEDGADYRNRIWMTQGELPMAGHPSLGTAVAVAHARGDREARYVQQTGAGLQPVEVAFGEELVASAAMLQEPAVFGEEVDPGEALGALGLDAADAHPELPPQLVSTGLLQLLVPVAEAAALDRARPDPARLHALLQRTGTTVAYLAFHDAPRGRALARSFFPEDGAVAEDPGTGSAAGPLCAYLHARTGAERVDVEQGVAMGRPCLIRCEAGERVRVAGDVTIVAVGELLL